MSSLVFYEFDEGCFALHWTTDTELKQGRRIPVSFQDQYKNHQRWLEHHLRCIPSPGAKNTIEEKYADWHFFPWLFKLGFSAHDLHNRNMDGQKQYISIKKKTGEVIFTPRVLSDALNISPHSVHRQPFIQTNFSDRIEWYMWAGVHTPCLTEVVRLGYLTSIEK